MLFTTFTLSSDAITITTNKCAKFYMRQSGNERRGSHKSQRICYYSQGFEIMTGVVKRAQTANSFNNFSFKIPVFTILCNHLHNGNLISASFEVMYMEAHKHLVCALKLSKILALLLMPNNSSYSLKRTRDKQITYEYLLYQPYTEIIISEPCFLFLRLAMSKTRIYEQTILMGC